MPENVLKISNRYDFRKWLSDNGKYEKECFVVLKRGKPKDDGQFYYLDAVEEALCFGWIDSTLGVVDGIRMQRFTPRAKNSNWSELNKERVRRLEKLGLMTDAGRKVLPDMTFHMDEDIENDIKMCGMWEKFISFPELYQRVRAYNLSFTMKKTPKEFDKAFEHFKEMTEKGEMYGQWNDYGRLDQ